MLAVWMMGNKSCHLILLHLYIDNNVRGIHFQLNGFNLYSRITF